MENNWILIARGSVITDGLEMSQVEELEEEVVLLLKEEMV